MNGDVWCSFYTERGLPINCGEEKTEHDLVHQYIYPNSTVLQIGGEYGAISCQIAKVQNNSGHLVAAEANKV